MKRNDTYSIFLEISLLLLSLGQNFWLSRLYDYKVILSIRLGSWNYRVLRLAIAQIPALNEFIDV
jgi:hypothetical protein